MISTKDAHEELRQLFRRIIPINARNRRPPYEADFAAQTGPIVQGVSKLRGQVTPADYARIYAEEKARFAYGARVQ